MVQNLQNPRWKAREPVCIHWRVQEQEVSQDERRVESILTSQRYATDIVRECSEAWEVCELLEEEEDEVEK